MNLLLYEYINNVSLILTHKYLMYARHIATFVKAKMELDNVKLKVTKTGTKTIKYIKLREHCLPLYNMKWYQGYLNFEMIPISIILWS